MKKKHQQPVNRRYNLKTSWSANEMYIWSTANQETTFIKQNEDYIDPGVNTLLLQTLKFIFNLSTQTSMTQTMISLISHHIRS